MPDSVSPADELRPTEQQQLAGPWSAADYGWDPADPNAVAWAAYYSELGWDPAAVQAHLAAEATGAATADVEPVVDVEHAVEPEPVVDVEPVVEAEPVAEAGHAIEVGSEPSALDRAPPGPELAMPALDLGAATSPEEPAASWDGPAALPSYAPDGDDVPAAAPLSGRTSLWDLGAVQAAIAAAAAPAPLPDEPLLESSVEFRHEVPQGWPGEPELVLRSDFERAGDGSFDPASTAALPGMAAEPPGLGGAASQPLDVDLQADDLAPPPAEAAEPGVPDLPPAPERVATLDLSAPFLGEPEPGAEPAPSLGPGPSLDWAAAHALAEDDPALDFGALDAGPGAEPLEQQRTALWSLPIPPQAPAPEAPPPEPAPLELMAFDVPAEPGLGEVPPIDLSSPDALEAAGEPLDLAPSSPPVPPDEVDAPPPPMGDADFFAFTASAPAEADAPPTPAPQAEVAEVAEVGDDDILEVGDDVLEVTEETPDALAAPVASAPPPASQAAHETLDLPSQPAFPDRGQSFEPALPSEPPYPGTPGSSAQPEPDTAVEEPLPPGPEAVAAGPSAPDATPDATAEAEAAFAAVEQAKPEPSPEAAPSTTFVAGTHRVVVHTADGQVKRGTLCDVALDAGEVVLAPQAGGAAEPLAADRIRAIFFMLPAGEAPLAPEGKKVRVTFRDGRQVAGFSPDYDPERVGFFMIPADTRTHTARIWVYRSSVRQVSVS